MRDASGAAQGWALLPLVVSLNLPVMYSTSWDLSKQACFCLKATLTWMTLLLPVRICIRLSVNNSFGWPGDILEIGAFWSIRTRDVPSFDRYFSQLQTFYTDYRCDFIPFDICDST
jgi:hypothetical protein